MTHVDTGLIGYLRSRVAFVVVLAAFALGTFVLAGGLTRLLPGQSTAILVGWILAAWLGGTAIKRRYLSR